MLVLQEVRVSVSRACDVVLTAGVDTSGVPGTLKARSTRTRGTEQQPVDGSLRWESHGGVGLAGVAYVTEFAGAEAERSVDENEVAPLATRYSFRGRSGRRYRLRQIAAIVSDAMHHEPDLQAVRLVFAGHGARFRPFTRRELGCVGRDLAGARPGRRASALAGDARRRVLLPADVRPRLVARQHVAVRARLLAELPLLPRSRHVGHRDVRRSAARPDQPGCGPIAPRVPGGAPAGGSPQRFDVGLPRSAVPVGEQPSIRGGVSARGGRRERPRAPCEPRRRLRLQSVPACHTRLGVGPKAGLGRSGRRRHVDRESGSRDGARIRDPRRKRHCRARGERRTTTLS